MELKIWCEHCNGIGTWYEKKHTITGVEETKFECMFCGGLGYKELDQETQRKLKLADMIDWAIKHETRFIECGVCGDNTFLAEIDLERLEQLYDKRGDE